MSLAKKSKSLFSCFPWFGHDKLEPGKAIGGKGNATLKNAIREDFFRGLRESSKVETAFWKDTLLVVKNDAIIGGDAVLANQKTQSQGNGFVATFTLNDRENGKVGEVSLTVDVTGDSYKVKDGKCKGTTSGWTSLSQAETPQTKHLPIVVVLCDYIYGDNDDDL